MATFNSPEVSIKIIRKDDDNFYIDNGIVQSPRAGFEISQECPDNYKLMLMTCIDNGWITPVAYMKESEYTWEKLGD